jgi:hypothetical protein
MTSEASETKYSLYFPDVLTNGWYQVCGRLHYEELFLIQGVLKLTDGIATWDDKMPQQTHCRKREDIAL